MSARAALAAATFLLAGLNAQIGPEKVLLIQTMESLRVALEARMPEEITARALQELQWLRNRAESWQPARDDEGRPLRKSLQDAVVALQRARKPGGRDADLLLAVADDLSIKRDHCGSFGLGAEQKVEVKTKRQGLTEVNGLEVWYLEKFLASDPAASPHRFKRFSSPALESLAPGRYVFWAKDPTNGRGGGKTEERVGLSTRPELTIAIEVLAP